MKELDWNYSVHNIFRSHTFPTIARSVFGFEVLPALNNLFERFLCHCQTLVQAGYFTAPLGIEIWRSQLGVDLLYRFFAGGYLVQDPVEFDALGIGSLARPRRYRLSGD